eukprot:TRINITY_DN37476_c0_g1_i1.p4 TRINITY_DN37476_c0_g1~~TRINITY_DN37476_c0_g1_i1.p4  ORF type:complete len:110 (+),score=12.06 TRINITY_DN37476_c0_g1_i1:959-1288(+)
MDVRSAGAQAVDSYPGEIKRTDDLEDAEQPDRLLNDESDTKEGVANVYKNGKADTASGQQGVGATLGEGLLQHDGKIRTRAGDGEKMYQCHGQKFGPIVLHVISLDQCL